MKKRIFTQEDCALFNKIREAHQNQTLKFGEMVKLFSSFTNGVRILQKFIKEGILIKVPGRGKYQFPKQPVYYKVLQAAWENKEEIVKQPTTKIKTFEDEIEDAILLLSDNGYKILKQVFDIESALKSPEKSVASFIRWEEVI